MSASRETRAIRAIARDVLRLPTLEERNSDRLDFHELAVWQIEKVLRAAYQAGAASVASPGGSGEAPPSTRRRTR